MKLNISFFRSYVGTLSFLVITIVASIYIFSRTSVELYPVFLSIISVLMIVGLFAIFVPYTFSFHLFFFSSVIFPAFNLSVWSVQRIPSYGLVSGVTIVLVGLITMIAHRYTYKKEFAISTVYEFTLIAFLFYLFGAVLFSSIPQLTPQMTIDSLFFMGIATFLLVSVQLTNIAYRVKILNEKLQVRNRIEKIETYAKALEKKSQYDQNNVAFILLYLKQSFEDFIAGDFERSFENAFKILFDEYRGQYVFKDIHQIENYRKRREKYAKIRNSLVHARARRARIKKTEDLQRIRKELFEKALDLLSLVKFEYMDIIAS